MGFKLIILFPIQLIIAVGFWSWLGGGNVWAQSDQGPTLTSPALPPARTGAQPSEPSLANQMDERVQLLEQLKNLQEKLQAGLKTGEEATPTGPVSRDGQASNSTTTATPTAVDDLEKIKKRLEVMRSLLNAKSVGQGHQSSMPPPTIANQSTNAAVPLNSVPYNGNAQQPANASTNVPESDWQTTPNTTAIAPNRDEPRLPAMPNSLPLLDQPTDIFELANCAFDVGEIEFALRLYDSPELKLTDPHDLNWRDYFVAGCYRAQGKIPEAIAAYRNVVNANKSSRAGASADWWLTHLKSKQELNAAMQELQSQLDHYNTLRKPGGK